jgi:16S rRNA (cytidine1402-2'-O)-methyltransferase
MAESLFFNTFRGSVNLAKIPSIINFTPRAAKSSDQPDPKPAEPLEPKQSLLEPGLYLVPGPLGNLGDLSQRAVKILSGADLIAAEDTRRTLKLLNYLGLKKPLVSYREQNHDQIWPKIRFELANQQSVALMTDAGAPAISDPGAKLVAEARREGYNIFPIPGPSAVITALMVSGFNVSGFTFVGFLPSKAAQRRQRLSSLKDHNDLLVFFESPHRLSASLADMVQILGSRQAFMAREMTKIHEEYLSLSLEELAKEVAANPRRGEITLVIAPSENFQTQDNSEGEALAQELDLERLSSLIIADPRPTNELAAFLAQKFQKTKKQMYSLILDCRKNLKL